MKYQITLDDKPSHCLYCPLKSIEDGRVLQTGCNLQKDNNGDFTYFRNWKEQMENCPIKEVKE